MELTYWLQAKHDLLITVVKQEDKKTHGQLSLLVFGQELNIILARWLIIIILPTYNILTCCCCTILSILSHFSPELKSCILKRKVVLGFSRYDIPLKCPTRDDAHIMNSNKKIVSLKMDHAEEAQEWEFLGIFKYIYLLIA